MEILVASSIKFIVFERHSSGPAGFIEAALST